MLLEQSNPKTNAHSSTKAGFSTMTYIRAGRTNEATPDSGEWVFVDVGFSKKSRSCGVLSGEGDPEQLTFSETKNHLVERATASTEPLNLVLEAPLSVAFDSKGNPTHRSIELRDGKQRYWYVSAGASVLVAATYLIRAISDASIAREIRLFEGLVSFKTKGSVSNHQEDVRLLHDVVWGKGEIVSPDKLRVSPDHTIRSAFAVSGMDYGVPPVIKVGGTT